MGVCERLALAVAEQLEAVPAVEAQVDDPRQPEVERRVRGAGVHWLLRIGVASAEMEVQRTSRVARRRHEIVEAPPGASASIRAVGARRSK